MNTILTDDERRELVLEATSWEELLCKTEAAVVAKLREQEPVAWVAYWPNGAMRLWQQKPEGPEWHKMQFSPVYAVPKPSVDPVAWLIDYDDTGEREVRFVAGTRGDRQTPLYAAPLPAVARCTNSDTWNCKYCRKTATCDALNDAKNFAAPLPAVVQVPQEFTATADNDFAYGYQDGWNACRKAMLAAAPEAPAQGEFVHDPACKMCGGRGYYVAGYSGREDDGNAPIHEECDCWIPNSEAPAPALVQVPREWRETIQGAIDELPYQHHLIPRLIAMLAAAPEAPAQEKSNG